KMAADTLRTAAIKVRCRPYCWGTGVDLGAQMFGSSRVDQSCVQSKSWAGRSFRSRGDKAAAAAGIALALSLFAASSAQAQNCAVANPSIIPNLGAVGASPAAVSSVIANTLTTASTAFLLQSTAFIGSPGNPAP